MASPQDDLRKAYLRADTAGREYSSKAFGLRLDANWLEGGSRLWYRRDLPDDHREFVLVDSSTGKKAPAFDHARLAAALAKATERPVDGTKLPFRVIAYLAAPNRVTFRAFEHDWECDLATYDVKQVASKPMLPPPRPEQWRQNAWLPEGAPVPSPDRQWTAMVRGRDVVVKPKSGDDIVFVGKTEGTAYTTRVVWSPDSKRLVAFTTTPGDRKQVHLIESTPSDGGPAKLESRVYDRPGDKVDTFTMRIIDVAAKTETPLDAEPVDYGDLPWIRWKRDQRHFTYEKMDRGYGRWRIIEADSQTGKTRTLVDDDPATFVDSTAQYTYYCENSDDIVWRSERDGWGHLYLSDGDGRIKNQITRGPWVVRSVVKIDEKARQIVFQASGMDPKEEPYFTHYYRIRFDGKGLTSLTPASGCHSIQLAPDGKTLVDTYSTVTQPPVHELRRVSDGKLLASLETADVSALMATGWRPPEPFVAKGRDGKTDIYGIVYRPTNFDPTKKYPVIEDIYAGPQDSYVPKTFSPWHWDRGLSEIGFIVVQIDGMGTRNRGKAFHDVCYKNLADAGFPDRILWMKALAQHEPAADIDRVGVFGTSAGGQNSTGALLFHPEFYKVAVSSCGCHDNRLDKIWWNEQWMGYPVGPEYSASSNTDNAAKLKGNLLLMVGELDDNVPPETTYRLADALIRANKEFELVVLPGQHHTAGGAFGERKRRDFFVRHLLGLEAPDWNK